MLPVCSHPGFHHLGKENNGRNFIQFQIQLLECNLSYIINLVHTLRWPAYFISKLYKEIENIILNDSNVKNIYK